MTLSYCERYSQFYEEPYKPLTVVQARKRHEKGQLYTVVIEQNGKVLVTVEMCFQTAYCHVSFYDELGRGRLQHSFVPAAPGQLFLQEIAEIHYRDDQDRIGCGSETLTVYTDGRSKLLSTVGMPKGKMMVEEGEGRLTNLDAFYEPEPAFGQYDSLIREDRGLDMETRKAA